MEGYWSKSKAGARAFCFEERRGGIAQWALAALMWLMAGAAEATDVQVHLFWREGCPHCARAMSMLDREAAADPRIRLNYHEIGASRPTLDAFGRAVDHFRLERPAVPLTVIGEQVFVGYRDDESTGRQYREAIAACLASACNSVAESFLADTESAASRPGMASSTVPPTIRVPLIGEVETATLSLPLLTVLLAAIDGFNPCAMWTLLFLIGLLLGVTNVARRWVLGFAFIATSAVIYYLFLVAWLNLLLFIGMVVWIRGAIAVLALGAGGYYLREFVRNPDATCTVAGAPARRRILDRLRSIAMEQHFWLALFGIVALAAAVNTIELICSAGIPAVYAQVLALSALPAWQYHGYLSLYIAIFMLDDLVVFVTAMKALEVTGLTGRYAHWSHLIGGVVMMAMGLVLLLRPGWLVFA